MLDVEMSELVDDEWEMLCVDDDELCGSSWVFGGESESGIDGGPGK